MTTHTIKNARKVCDGRPARMPGDYGGDNPTCKVCRDKLSTFYTADNSSPVLEAVIESVLEAVVETAIESFSTSDSSSSTDTDYSGGGGDSGGGGASGDF